MNASFDRIFLKKRYPLQISRGTITGSENLFVTVKAFGQTGVGELAAATTETGENCQTGYDQLKPFIDGLPDNPSIVKTYAEARARGIGPRALAALDIALWDAFAKQANQPLWRLFGLSKSAPPTSLTVGINPPEITRERVPEILARTGAKSLKIKLGSPDGIEADKQHFLAARDAAKPFKAALRIDANGGWNLSDAKTMLQWLAERDVAYVEQPLKKGDEDQLPELFKKRPIPIYVDESIWYASDIPKLADRVDGINLKLMKCGGLTEALRILATARAHGLGTMIGCMGESSIDISAGAAISSLCDHVDLDSHFNLINDPAIGAEMLDGVVTPNDKPGHGASFIL